MLKEIIRMGHGSRGNTDAQGLNDAVQNGGTSMGREDDEVKALSQALREMMRKELLLARWNVETNSSFLTNWPKIASPSFQTLNLCFLLFLFGVRF